MLRRTAEKLLPNKFKDKEPVSIRADSWVKRSHIGCSGLRCIGLCWFGCNWGYLWLDNVHHGLFIWLAVGSSSDQCILLYLRRKDGDNLTTMSSLEHKSHCSRSTLANCQSSDTNQLSRSIEKSYYEYHLSMRATLFPTMSPRIC